MPVLATSPAELSLVPLSVNAFVPLIATLIVLGEVIAPLKLMLPAPVTLRFPKPETVIAPPKETTVPLLLVNVPLVLVAPVARLKGTFDTGLNPLKSRVPPALTVTLELLPRAWVLPSLRVLALVVTVPVKEVLLPLKVIT